MNADTDHLALHDSAGVTFMPVRSDLRFAYDEMPDDDQLDALCDAALAALSAPEQERSPAA